MSGLVSNVPGMELDRSRAAIRLSWGKLEPTNIFMPSNEVTHLRASLLCSCASHWPTVRAIMMAMLELWGMFIESRSSGILALHHPQKLQNKSETFNWTQTSTTGSGSWWIPTWRRACSRRGSGARRRRWGRSRGGIRAR